MGWSASLRNFAIAIHSRSLTFASLKLGQVGPVASIRAAGLTSCLDIHRARLDAIVKPWRAEIDLVGASVGPGISCTSTAGLVSRKTADRDMVILVRNQIEELAVLGLYGDFETGGVLVVGREDGLVVLTGCGDSLALLCHLTCGIQFLGDKLDLPSVAGIWVDGNVTAN